MICDHLLPLEQELTARGIPITYRGQPWSRNCREWVHFTCYLDLPAIRARLQLPPCVEDHVNDDPRSGCEQGFVCSEHHDAVIGLFKPEHGKPTIK